MKRKIYEFLIPKTIREQIYQANVRQFHEAEIERLSSIEESLPKADLSAVFIANLRILPGRNAFLNVMPKQSIVADIGVGRENFNDFSSRILLVARPKILHLIDKWEEKSPDTESNKIIEHKLREEIATGQVSIERGSPGTILEGFRDSYFDWIYIDTETSYSSIEKLLEICGRKVKAGGIIAGRNYVFGSLFTRERYGVVEAVNGYCKANRWEIIYLTNESHRNLSYAIKRMMY